MSQADATEQANSQLVRDFIAAWLAPEYDVEATYTHYLAPNCVHRMSEDHPPLTTAAAAIAAMKDFFASGGAVTEATITEIFARGPLVITVRDDMVRIPGQGDVPFRIAAVFVVKGGKITEWNEYFM